MTNLITPIEDALVNLPNTVYGLAVAWASNTTFTVAAGTARDSTNVFDITIASAITVNAAVVGVNGIDTGSLGASSQYAVFVIASSTNTKAPACLFSLSATAPALPVGYDKFRRIGWIFTDSSSHFLLAYQSGTGLVRQYQYDGTQGVLTSGGTQTAFTAIDLSACVPAVDNIPISINTYFTPNAAADECAFRPTGSSDASGLSLGGPVAGKETVDIVSMIAKLSSGKAKIDYKVAASGALLVYVVGFTDYL